MKQLFCLLVLCALNQILSAAPLRLNSWLTQSHHCVSITNSSIGMPTHLINGRLQPGIEYNIVHPFGKQAKKHRPEYAGFTGYMAQRSLQRSFYMGTAIAYRFFSHKKYSVSPQLGIAAALTRQTNPEFTIINNTIQQVGTTRLQLLPHIGLSAQVHLAQVKHMDIALTAQYRFVMQLPFSKLSSLLPINQISIGTIIQKRP